MPLIRLADVISEVAEAYQDYIGSPMIVTGGEITEGTNAGTFKVAALTALLRKTDSDTGELDYVTKTEEDNIAIPLADTNYYVILNYNAGSPTISLITDTHAFNDEIPLGSVMKTASDEVFVISGCYRLQDGVAKLHYRAFELYHLHLTSGNTIAYSGTNNFTMNAGVVYEGINRLTQDAYDSAVTQFKAVYRNGTGGWTEVDRNTIDFNHYDDGDGTLGDISPNRYSCHWVYRRSGDGAVYVLYGRDSYTLAEAEVAEIPASQPDYFTNFGCLIGRIVAPVAGGSFASIAMATDTVFASTAVATHNELGGLNANDYKHLTAVEYAFIALSKITAAAGEDIVLGMGDSAGTNKVSYKDYGGNEVASVDSDGNAVFHSITQAHGVSWDESQATGGYSRTGSLAGLATSQSLADALLPIQASMRRCILSDSGVVQYYLDATDSTKKVGGASSNLDGTDGQVMVEIPAFYYKYGYSGTTHTWEISQHPLAGFSIHPAFIKNDGFVPYRYMSAYEGILYDTSASRYTNGLQLPAVSMTFANATSIITCASLSHPFTLLEAGDKFVIAGTTHNNGTLTVASKTDQTITTVEALTDETAGSTTLEIEKNWATDVLGSVSGKAPINYGTRANFRTASATRGTGWRQQDYDLASAIQLLYLIEYADWNSQLMIGAGLTDWDSAWPAWNSYNPVEKTGLSNILGNATGNVSNGDGINGSYMSYRGIENFFGHLWKWVDGINTNNNIPYICNNDTHFADNTVANYIDLGIVLAASNGYQKTLEQQSRGFLPASVGGASNTYVPDFYYQDTGWRVAMLGGRTGDGVIAGVAYLYLQFLSNSRYPHVASRLCR